MDLESFFESAQDRNGVFHGRLIDQDLLESALQSGILFDVLAVLVKSRRADAVELASGEFWLQQVACVHSSLGLSGADDVVQLVDEQQNPAVGFLNFVEHGLEPLFKLTSVLGARDKGSHVQSEDGLVLQSFRYVSVQDSLGQPFNDCRLADTRFSDQDRIVFGSSGEDLDGVTDLSVTSDDRIQLAFPCHLDKVPAVLVQCVVSLLRILAGHPLVSAHLIQGVQEAVLAHSVSPEDLGARRIPLIQKRHIQMFYADVFILQLPRLLLRVEQKLLEPSGRIHLVRASADLRQFVQLCLNRAYDFAYVDIGIGQQFRDQPVLLLQQRHMEMFPVDLLMPLLNGDVLAIDDRLLCFLCVFLDVHMLNPLYFRYLTSISYLLNSL